MKTIITTSARSLMLVLAPLSLVVSVPQAALAVTPSGHKFCEAGMGSPQQLKQKILAALAKDPTGTKITLEGCKATAALFLQAFQTTKSGAGLKTVNDLAEFLDRLVPITVDANNTFDVSCLWDTANGREVKMECEQRPLRPGEVVYGDRETRELLIMGSCANPGIAVIPPIVVQSPCIEVKAPSMGVKVAVRFAYFGDKPLPGKCVALQMAGETQKRFDLPEECPDTYEVMRGGRKVKVVCTWDDVEMAASAKLGKRVQVQNVSGSFYSRADGTNSLFLPAEALEGMTAFCWELADGTVVTVGVSREHFVDRVAAITPTHVRTLRWQGQ